VLRSRQNPRVQEARKLARQPTLARREGILVAEGPVLVREAMDAHLRPRVIFLDPGEPEAASLLRVLAARRMTHVEAHHSVLSAISTLTTPQAAIGIFERPHHDLRSLLAGASIDGPPVVAVLHGLQDPSNAGSLVRSGLAMGLSGVIATAGTVDLFHPRAVRGAMGASFRLPLVVDVEPATLWEILRQGSYRLLGLDPRGDLDLPRLRSDVATAVVLGREGSGLDREAQAACTASVRIPMAGGVESLGVAAAGAIVFYALRASRITGSPP
jgi:TrmH family RNA methyltransferase